MAEDTPPGTEVEAFLSRLGSADQEELERASSAVRSDRSAWEAAGGRAAQIVASLGLDEQKAQFCERARVIVERKAVQIQGEDRKFAIWANGVKLSGDWHQPEGDLGQGRQPGGLAWLAGLIPSAWALGLAFVAASRAARDEVAVPGDLGGQVGGKLVKLRRGKSIRSR